MNPAIFTAFVVGNYSTQWSSTVSSANTRLQGNALFLAKIANASMYMKQAHKEYELAKTDCSWGNDTSCARMIEIQRALYTFNHSELECRVVGALTALLDIFIVWCHSLSAIALAFRAMIHIILLGFA